MMMMMQIMCTMRLVPQSECQSMTNTTCLCTSEPLNNALLACVTKSCTIRESLGTYVACYDRTHLFPIYHLAQ
jgi:hypothetical protein